MDGQNTFSQSVGGQNPIEPISIGLPLVTGSNYQNFRETCGDLLLHDAILEAPSAEEGKIILSDLATNQEKRKFLGLRAHAWRKSKDPPLGIRSAVFFKSLKFPSVEDFTPLFVLPQPTDIDIETQYQ